MTPEAEMNSAVPAAPAKSSKTIRNVAIAAGVAIALLLWVLATSTP